jgi:hypothetical protein
LTTEPPCGNTPSVGVVKGVVDVGVLAGVDVDVVGGVFAVGEIEETHRYVTFEIQYNTLACPNNIYTLHVCLLIIHKTAGQLLTTTNVVQREMEKIYNKNNISTYVKIFRCRRTGIFPQKTVVCIQQARGA